MPRSKRMTEQDLQVILAKRNYRDIDMVDEPDEADPGSESELQCKIRAHSKKMGWPEPLIFPQTPAVKRFMPPGWPDCTIPIPKHILLAETKAAKGKLSGKQKQTRFNFGRQGHIIHKINSFKGYLKLVDNLTRRE